jgi:glycosyltransferase involved in cell wall biosynthesis
VLSQLANHWQKAGEDVRFLAPAGSGHPYFPTSVPIVETRLGGTLSEAGEKLNGPGRLVGLHGVLALRAGLARLSGTADVVLANHSLTAWSVASAPSGGARRFYYVQAYEPEYYWMERQPAKWLLARLSYSLPLHQIVNSPTYVEQGPVRPIGLVPPGLDLEVYAPKPRPRDFSDGAPIWIGCIGRHEPQKGTPYVLAAFEALHARDPRYRLRVAYGNLPTGYQHPAMETVVPRNDAELSDFYRGIDILVAAGTVQHGAPHYPVMEAMACATPVVTTGYMPAGPDNSWIVANRSADAIVDAVQNLVADPGTPARVTAASEAISAFGWPAIAGRMLDLFRAQA